MSRVVAKALIDDVCACTVITLLLTYIYVRAKRSGILIGQARRQQAQSLLSADWLVGWWRGIIKISYTNFLRPTASATSDTTLDLG